MAEGSSTSELPSTDRGNIYGFGGGGYPGYEKIPQKTSRRELFGNAIKVFAGGFITYVLGKFAEDSTNYNKKQAEENLEAAKREYPRIEPKNNKSLQQASKNESIKTADTAINSALNEISKIVLTQDISKERIEKEKEYVQKYATNLAAIDKGLWVCVSMGARDELRNKRWVLRQQGKEGLKPLAPYLIEWAKRNSIHPEVLALAIEARAKAVEVVTKILNKQGNTLIGLRPDLADEISQERLPKDFWTKLNPENLIINAGGLAKLCDTETGGFINIGHRAAVSQINQKKFPTAIDDLKTLCDKISLSSGINLNYANIPGSKKVEGQDVSGGAIGIQMMPSKALEIANIMESVGEKFNPFDPLSSLVGAAIELSRGEAVKFDNNGKPVDFRYGWLQGTGNQRENSLCILAVEKWNQHEQQANEILITSQKFNDEIIKT